MARLKKITGRVLLILALLIPVAALAHYFVFPQETRSMLVGFSSLKKKGDIYFDVATPPQSIDSLEIMIEKASATVAAFWGEKKSNPGYIYCATEKDFSKYGSPNLSVPACTYFKLGTHIVLSKDGLDEDIIAHEISHAELYKRTGFFKWTFTLPTWFKQGLAMQNDNRDYYSEDTLAVRITGLMQVPDVKSFTDDASFYAGSTETIMLHYMLAKREIRTWYRKEKLLKFIKDLNAGDSFEAAYKGK